MLLLAIRRWLGTGTETLTPAPRCTTNGWTRIRQVPVSCTVNAGCVTSPSGSRDSRNTRPPRYASARWTSHSSRFLHTVKRRRKITEQQPSYTFRGFSPWCSVYGKKCPLRSVFNGLHSCRIYESSPWKQAENIGITISPVFSLKKKVYFWKCSTRVSAFLRDTKYATSHSFQK